MENGEGTGEQGETTPVSPLHWNLQVASFQRRERLSQPLCASCCTVLLYFSRFCNSNCFIFGVCFFCTCNLCEKYCKAVLYS